MPSYDEQLGSGAVRPLCRGVASSEAEMGYSLEGRFATLERGGDMLRGRGSRGEPSSEAEMSHPLEGRSATLERGGDCPAGPSGTLERGGDRPAGSRRMRMGRTLGFFESFPFFQIGRRSWAFVGPTALTGVCIFKAILVPRLGCP